MILSDLPKKLLYELSLNARAELSELAKQLQTSKQVISYHLAQLEKKQIIEGYFAITNPYSIGKTHYRVFVKLQNINDTQEKELLLFLKNDKKIVWVAEYGGDWDIAYIIWADSVFEFEQINSKINARFGRFFYKKDIFIVTAIEYLKYNFWSDKISKTAKILTGRNVAVRKLDSLDKKILEHLNANGREPAVFMAKQYQVTAATIQNRIKKLIRDNVIVGFQYKLNYRLLGLTHRKILLTLNDFSPEAGSRLEIYLKSNPYVIYLVKSIGNYDFEFEVMTKNDEDFQNLLHGLRRNFPEEIKTYSSVIHFSEPKSGQLMEI